MAREEEVPPRRDQEQPEPPHIKEEQEELWSSQEGEQLGGLEEADITRFIFTPVPVKTEEEEEKPQSSQLHQGQTEEDREAEPPASSSAEHMETEADGEDCGGPEPVIDYKTSEFSVAEIEVSCDDWEESSKPQSGLKATNEDRVRGLRCGSPETPFSCPECGKTFTKPGFLETHMRIHTGEKPFSCSVCGKRYRRKGYLLQHMVAHRREKRQSCSVCHRRLVWHSGEESHRCVSGLSQPHLPSPASGMSCNTGGESLSFSECDKNLCYSHHLKAMGAHTEESLFSCSVCGRKFTQRGYLIQHMARHTGKIRFRCCVCEKKFAWRHELKNHKCGGDSSQPQSQTEENGESESPGGSDTDDKTSDSSEPEPEARDDEWKDTRAPPPGPNTEADNEVSASDVGSSTDKASSSEDGLKVHGRTDAGQNPPGCSLCEQGFTREADLPEHMEVHAEEKRFLYCVCGKRFAWRYNLKDHQCVGPSSQARGPAERGEAAPPAGGSRVSRSAPRAEVGDDACEDTRSVNRLNEDEVLEAAVSSNDAERPFACSQCGKRFRRKKNLQEHMRIHTGEKPYGCSVCMKYFSCSGSLRKHLRIHTGEKPFGCSVCGNRFTESGHLKVHMRTHTGEKPFSCSVCGKSFTWRQSFNNHMKYHTETTAERN